MYSDNKYYLWTPLVGFDMDKADCGAEEYLNKIPSKPTGISLFVFNADICYLHQGLEKEVAFPPSYCNYYGAVRNEVRSIQPWTNLKLKTLIDNLKKRGVESYLGIMGVHTTPEDAKKVSGNFGYIARQEYLVENQEACIEGTPWTGHTYLLKRLKDGSFFEDFFVEKVKQTLIDYEADGIHLSDALFPPCMQLQEGDFSFDMLDQFTTHTGIKLPEGMTYFIKDNKYTDIKKRAEYVWNNYRLQWIRFIGYRWEVFLKKLCDGLHSVNKKVMLNNCWMSEPFESIYRYGINYNSLTNAGVDIICQEQQATVNYMNESIEKDDERGEIYCKNMLMRAYAPNVECITITFAKDSTEEASMISHLPCAWENEQFQLANYYSFENGKWTRTIDGYFVDLGDALTEREWEYLVNTYEKIFKDDTFNLLAPTLVWSDDYLSDTYISEYIRDRRWSVHKFLWGVNKYGGGIHGVVNEKELDGVDADLFVPNIDLLSNEVVEKIKNYKKGKVIVTLPKEKDNLGFDGIRIEDTGVTDCGARTVCYVLNTDKDYSEIINNALEIKDDSLDLDFSKPIKDTRIWTDDVVFRKVSSGFLTAIAKILKSVSIDRHGITAEDDSDFTVVEMADGAKRIIMSADCFYKYKRAKIITRDKFIRVENKGDFPAQPFKLLLSGGQIVADTGDESISNQTVGFLIKTTPGGVAVADVYTEKN